MKPPERKLLRAAQKIGEIYRRESTEPSPSLPERTWREVARVEGMRRRSQRGKWGAQQSLNRALRVRIDELRRALDDYAIGLARQSSDDQPSLRTLYDDLVALAHEFDEVRVDLHEQRLSVITSPILLDSVQLGRFEIRLRWPRLLSGKAYGVVALEPMPAATNNSVTHPHVQDNSLCEGEGQLAIRAALKQGRLLDFFLLVRQILETYNSGSAYVPLSDWFGVTCSDCGTTAGEEESCTCGHCGSDLCDDCSRSCNSCGQSSCSGCSSRCAGCDVDYCTGCISACRDCGESYCSECLTSRQCSNCRENEEDDLEENEGEPNATDEAKASAAVHAVRLGEAGVPA